MLSSMSLLYSNETCGFGARRGCLIDGRVDGAASMLCAYDAAGDQSISDEGLIHDRATKTLFV
jgi:hypothetical protein